jgi:TetR/AcrR family transcriptional regulator, cholesterol catabolism regulator
VKHKIVEQSIELFELKGFSETSIQDVVDALGVTKGTFYYYFDSKEQLLMDIHSKYIDELLIKQQQILDHPSKDYKTKLFENVELLLKQIKTHGRLARVFFREMRNLNQDHVMEIKEKRERFRLNLQKIIELGIENGEFRQDLKADIVTFGILGLCNWSYNWFNPNGPVSDDELTEIYIEMILRGICSNQ